MILLACYQSIPDRDDERYELFRFALTLDHAKRIVNGLAKATDHFPTRGELIKSK